MDNGRSLNKTVNNVNTVMSQMYQTRNYGKFPIESEWLWVVKAQILDLKTTAGTSKVTTRTNQTSSNICQQT